jgi:hypothetical protein
MTVTHDQLVSLIRDGVVPVQSAGDDTPRQGWLSRMLGKVTPPPPDPKDELRKAVITAAEESGLDHRTLCAIIRDVALQFERECRAYLRHDQTF